MFIWREHKSGFRVAGGIGLVRAAIHSKPLSAYFHGLFIVAGNGGFRPGVLIWSQSEGNKLRKHDTRKLSLVCRAIMGSDWFAVRLIFKGKRFEERN